MQEFSYCNEGISAIVFNGNSIISGSLNGAILKYDYNVIDKNCNKIDELTNLKGHFGDINCIDIQEDGKLIASGGNDKLIIIWKATSDKKLYTLNEHKYSVTALKFINYGTKLVSGSEGGEILIWSVADYSRVRGMLVEKYDGFYTAIKHIVIINEDLIAITTGNKISLYDVKINNVENELDENKNV